MNSIADSDISHKDNGKIHRVVWLLGSIMFLINLSFVMVYSYVGPYMKSLGVTMVWIGFAEGVTEGFSYLMKLFSGMFSDYLKKRKPVIVVGYSLILISRIIFGIARSFVPFFAARLIERVGNGIQSTPRDTIVADVSHHKKLGASYGLKRTLSQAGSVAGALLGLMIMCFVADADYLLVFRVAAVPAVIAYLILIFFIDEPKSYQQSQDEKHSDGECVANSANGLNSVDSTNSMNSMNSAHTANNAANHVAKSNIKLQLMNPGALGRSFWYLMLIVGIFMVSRFGETFLTIYACSNHGLNPKYAPIIMIVFNIGWCLSVYPVGVFADKFNRYWFLIMGILFLIVANMFLFLAQSISHAYIGCFFWGVQYGVTQNIFLSMIAERVPKELRGTGFGYYYIICSVSALAADMLAGCASQHYGNRVTFIASACIGVVSVITLAITMIVAEKEKSKYARHFPN